jgi:hypothetical protein
MASVAEDNIVQVWQMCENIYLQEDDLPDVGIPSSPHHRSTSYLDESILFICQLQAAAHELEGNAE